MRCLVDEHLSRKLIRALRQHGIDVITPSGAGLHSSADDELASYALAEFRWVITNDRDYPRLAGIASQAGDPFPSVIFWPQQSRGLGYLIAEISTLLQASDASDAVGAVVYL